MENIDIDLDIVIRSIIENDLHNNKDAIIKMLYDNYCINFPHQNNLSFYAEKKYDDMISYFKQGSAFIIGAFCKNLMIGFLWAYKKTFFEKSRIHISHIVVNMKFRSIGIGTRMMSNLEAIAKKESIDVIELMTSIDNTNTVRFYEGMMYKVIRIQLEKNL